jgi:hypothetical protein
MLRVEWWVFGALLLAVPACTDPEPLCEKACAYAEKCDLWMPEGDCVDYCVRHYDDSSGECREKFEAAVNCFGTEEMCRYDTFACSDRYHDADGWVDGSM